MNDSDHVVAMETVSEERLRTHLSVDGWSAMKSLTSSEVRSLVSELLASRLAKQAPEDACPSCGGSGRYGDAAQRSIDALIPDLDMVPSALRDVLAERELQIAKGYDAAHDDEHVDCEIMTHQIWGIAARAHNARTIMMPLAYRKAVVELVAMGLAEIERVDRSLAPEADK